MLKRIKIYTLFSASLILVLSACVKYEFTKPEPAVYNPGIEATTFIGDLVNLYEGGLTYLDTNVVISGTVIANDKSGNLYKAIIIQDSTAGIEISLNAYELHNNYHVGDLIYVKCRGLYLGEYGGIVKLGSKYEGDIGRIEEPLINQHLFKSDGGIPIVPKELSLVTPNASYINQLIVIKDAQFSISYIGNTYADADLQIDGEIPIEDCDGNSMIVRTSGYADFARDTIASGNGQIIAVLGMYNSEYQLLIRDINEVNFDSERCGDLFYEDFSNSLGQFTEHDITGTHNSWIQDEFSGTTYAKMTGYYSGKAYEASEDWLITNSINLNDVSSAVLNFTHVVNYLTTWNDIKVYISTDYNGTSDPNTSGTWTELTGWAHSAGDDWVFVDSGDIDISSYTANSNVYIAFKYTSPSNDASTWEIDKVSVSVL